MLVSESSQQGVVVQFEHHAGEFGSGRWKVPQCGRVDAVPNQRFLHARGCGRQGRRCKWAVEGAACRFLRWVPCNCSAAPKQKAVGPCCWLPLQAEASARGAGGFRGGL
eukprot:10453665-Heterocapsa_arctica.AAC.1